MSEHCKDCCCARSWEALGITGYTGKSIPEEIASLRNQLVTSEAACGRQAAQIVNLKKELQDARVEVIRIIDDLREWGSSAKVTNFLFEYRNTCFQVRGRYDGAMSTECAAGFERSQSTTEWLLKIGGHVLEENTTDD